MPSLYAPQHPVETHDRDSRHGCQRETRHSAHQHRAAYLAQVIDEAVGLDGGADAVGAFDPRPVRSRRWYQPVNCCL